MLAAQPRACRAVDFYEDDEDPVVVWGHFDRAPQAGRNGVTAPTDTARWHALDAPHRLLADWVADLEDGTCTRCGAPARRGDRHWWHVDGDGCWTRHGTRWPAVSRAQFRGH